MHWVVVISLLLTTACGGGTPASIDSGCAPVTSPSHCVSHGLDGVDLTGAWTVTGTSTDDHCFSGMPTVSATTRQITLAVSDCSFGDPSPSGTIDDTAATISRPDATGLYGTQLDVCLDVTTNALTYTLTSTARCIPTSANPDTITVTGTLSR